MHKRFKWIYVDQVMWISYLPFMYFAILQLKNLAFETTLAALSSIIAIIVIITYPLYPFFILYQIFKADHYNVITLK
jgi:hypothetical protein